MFLKCYITYSLCTYWNEVFINLTLLSISLTGKSQVPTRKPDMEWTFHKSLVDTLFNLRTNILPIVRRDWTHWPRGHTFILHLYRLSQLCDRHGVCGFHRLRGKGNGFPASRPSRKKAGFLKSSSPVLKSIAFERVLG